MSNNSRQFAAALKKTATAVSHLSRQAIEAALDRAAIRIDADIELKYNRGLGPDGQAWEPRKGKQSWPLLNRTGHLKNSRQVEVISANLKISYPVDYATYVNEVRQLVPTTIPPLWIQIVREEIAKELQKVNTI